MPDFATRRTVMVDTQVRPADVTKFPVIHAMLSIPRERYVPADKRELAYLGENIELGGGRVILDPRSFARMLDELNPRADELVLDVGAALGYSSAVIARMAEGVVALEEDKGMAAEAEATLAQEGVDNVAVLHGPLAEGAPQHGPYDAMMVQGAVERLPEALTGQLREGGRIACLFMEGQLGVARIGYKRDGHLDWWRIFDAGAPVLPGFARPAEFVF